MYEDPRRASGIPSYSPRTPLPCGERSSTSTSTLSIRIRTHSGNESKASAANFRNRSSENIGPRLALPYWVETCNGAHRTRHSRGVMASRTDRKLTAGIDLGGTKIQTLVLERHKVLG